jgi:hypothetical protein
MSIVAIRYYVGSLVQPQNRQVPGAGNTDTRESFMWVRKPLLFTQGEETELIQPGIYRIKNKQKIREWGFEENPYFTINAKTGEKEYILPFILTHKDHPIDRLLNFSNGSSISESAVMFAVLLTQANELMKYQAYLLLVMSAPAGVELDIPPGIKVGPGNLLKAPNGGSVTAVDMQARIKDFVEAIHQRVSTFMVQQGIPPSAFTLTGQPQSGYSLKIDRSTLVDIREKEIPNYRCIEKELFEMVRVVNNHSYKGIADKMISDSAEFHIDFAEMRFDPSPDEQMRSDTWGIANGTLTPVDVMLRENPDMSVEDATAQYLKNKAMMGAAMKQPLKQPGEPGAMIVNPT